MSDESSIMSDGNNNSLEVILVRMEGKIDRQGDRMQRYEHDITGVKTRIHDIAQQVQIYNGLGLPERIALADAVRANHDARIVALENIEQQRKGAAGLVRILWTVVGFLGVGGVATIIKVFGG